ncbi:MAG: hypothetical protein V4586_14720 [Pseudomonadota bacterium]
MANAKPKTEENKPPVTGPVAEAPNGADAGAVTGDGTGTILPEIGAADAPAQRKGAGLLDPDAPSDQLTTATIIVRGPAKGRWRIGRHFGPEPVSIPEADLTSEQKYALANDPELLVQLIDPTY